MVAVAVSAALHDVPGWSDNLQSWSWCGYRLCAEQKLRLRCIRYVKEPAPLTLIPWSTTHCTYAFSALMRLITGIGLRQGACFGTRIEFLGQTRPSDGNSRHL